LKGFHLALSVADGESPADEYTQRLGCRSDLLIPGEYALWRTGMRLTCRFGKWATKRMRLAGAMGRAMWLGVAMLSSSDYLDGAPGRLSLLVPCASKSICFRVLS
jgi:hypothetical protein